MNGQNSHYIRRREDRQQVMDGKVRIEHNRAGLVLRRSGLFGSGSLTIVFAYSIDIIAQGQLARKKEHGRTFKMFSPYENF